MQKLSVYLAGPITVCSIEQVGDWHSAVAETLYVCDIYNMGIMEVSN